MIVIDIVELALKFPEDLPGRLPGCLELLSIRARIVLKVEGLAEGESIIPSRKTVFRPPEVIETDSNLLLHGEDQGL